jgi:predicted nucleotidyltransferase
MAAVARRPEMDREAIIGILEANRETLRRFGVRSLSLFGSTVRGEARADSDVDVLVEFEPGARVGLFTFSRLQRCLEELLGRPVDLATAEALHRSLKQGILEEAVRAV